MSSSLQTFVHCPDRGSRRRLGHLEFARLADGDETRGQFSLMVVRGPVGAELSLHVHQHEEEWVYVLRGAVEVRVGQDFASGGPGEFVRMPAGVEHSFRIIEPNTRFLSVITPANLDAPFWELSDPVVPTSNGEERKRFDPAHFAAVFGRRGVVFGGQSSGDARANHQLWIRPAVGRSRWHMGQLMTSLVQGDEAGGRIALMEVVTQSGQELPLHVHKREDEGLFLIEGAALFTVGNQKFEASVGSFVFLPRDVPHTFRLTTDTARMLVFLTPSGLDRYFEEVSEPAGSLTRPSPRSDVYDPGEMKRAGARFGLQFLLAGG